MLVELARETSHACPFDSRAELAMEAPVRRIQAGSFWSSEKKGGVGLVSSLRVVRRSFLRPGVEVPDRSCRTARRCVLDLDFGSSG